MNGRNRECVTLRIDGFGDEVELEAVVDHGHGVQGLQRAVGALSPKQMEGLERVKDEHETKLNCCCCRLYMMDCDI